MVTFVWMILGDRIRITWDYVEILTIRISIPRRIRSAQPMRSRDKLHGGLYPVSIEATRRVDLIWRNPENPGR